MNELQLEIITPSKKAYSGMIKSIIIPGTAGSFQVLFNHAPILSTFEIGIIKIEFSEDKTLYFSTGGGTVEVTDNNILILADSIEKVEDVDRTKNAIEKTKKKVEKKK